jgi:phage terminase Nu1 subunit (DNA packaging protein)
VKVAEVLSVVVPQADFAELVGVSEAKVSQMVSEGTILRGATCAEWLVQYVTRLREQAAGRMGDGGGLDLVQERAGLAREQREHYRIKNAVAKAEFAPIGLLSDVLASASSAVVDRFDALPGYLRKACPDLPIEARDAIDNVIAGARNEWIRATAELTVRRLEELADAAEAEPAFDLDEAA